jgi:hypothetical protein
MKPNWALREAVTAFQKMASQLQTMRMQAEEAASSPSAVAAPPASLPLPPPPFPAIAIGSASGPGFDLVGWLAGVHVRLVPFERVLRDHAFDDRDTLATLDEAACVQMNIPLGLTKLLLQAARPAATKPPETPPLKLRPAAPRILLPSFQSSPAASMTANAGAGGSMAALPTRPPLIDVAPVPETVLVSAWQLPRSSPRRGSASAPYPSVAPPMDPFGEPRSPLPLPPPSPPTTFAAVGSPFDTRASFSNSGVGGAADAVSLPPPPPASNMSPAAVVASPTARNTQLQTIEPMPRWRKSGHFVHAWGPHGSAVAGAGGGVGDGCAAKGSSEMKAMDSLAGPAGICVSGHPGLSVLAVADTGHHRVQAWKLPATLEAADKREQSREAAAWVLGTKQWSLRTNGLTGAASQQLGRPMGMGLDLWNQV